MASVTIANEAFADERFDELAVLAGLTDADHARGKMARLWRQCTIEQTHVASEITVRRILGDRGVEALIASRLGSRATGGIRIKGTKGRIEWLGRLRKNGKFGKLGGRPAKTQKGSKENPAGFEKKTPSSSSSSSSTATSQERDLSAPSGVQEIPGTTPRADLPPSKKGRSPDVARALGRFAERFAAENDGAKPTAPSGRLSQAMSALVTRHGADEVMRRVDNAFEAPPTWPPPPYDLATFVRHFDKFARRHSPNGTAHAKAKSDPVALLDAAARRDQ